MTEHRDEEFPMMTPPDAVDDLGLGVALICLICGIGLALWVLI